MVDVGPSTESEMVLAFLRRAEIDSPRFAACYRHHLERSGATRKLIDEANLADAAEGEIRARLLRECRGYRANQYLFQRWPLDVQWRRVRLTCEEVSRLRYANHETWVTLSAGTRRVVDGARNVLTVQTRENANAGIIAVAEQVRTGRQYPELIACQTGEESPVLVEGHTRATAYVLAAIPGSADVLLGSSPRMRQWVFY